MEISIICQDAVVCPDYQIVLVRHPFRYIGFVGSDGLINRRLPAVKIIGKPHRIFRLGSSCALLKVFIDDISLVAVDATLSELIGDRELCLLPFGGVGNVFSNLLVNELIARIGRTVDTAYPAVELPAVLAFLFSDKNGCIRADQNVLYFLLFKSSMRSREVNNREMFFLTIRNIISICVTVVYDRDIFIA